MQRQYTLHEDPGHAWLEVSIFELASLRIKDKITEFSYVSGERVFLEEDYDAQLFIHAYKNRHGFPPSIQSTYNNNTPIRSYERFNIDKLFETHV